VGSLNEVPRRPPLLDGEQLHRFEAEVKRHVIVANAALLADQVGNERKTRACAETRARGASVIPHPIPCAATSPPTSSELPSPRSSPLPGPGAPAGTTAPRSTVSCGSSARPVHGRDGAAWRDVPERYGPYRTVYDRFARYRDDGTLDRILGALRLRLDADGHIDWATWMVDATSVRASRVASGARKRGGKGGVRRQRKTKPSGAAEGA
jgi:transposase